MDDDDRVLQAVIDVVATVARREITPRHLHSRRERKSDGSVVTEADRAASAALIEALPRIVDRPVVSEEMPAEQQLALWRAGAGDFWCIDPLDGTSNFANGLTQFAVSVALLRGGRPIVGVIHAPSLDETFSARRDGGAFCNGVPLPLRPPAAGLREAIAGVDLKRLPRPLAARLAAAPPYHSQRNLGSSAIELAYTAAGRYDLYLHGAQKMWDYSAGALILLEAGGAIASLGGADFWSQDPWQRSVVAAATPALLAPWLAWLTPS
jgi:myo-inositol-1(or 4)-monophosphatase